MQPASSNAGIIEKIFDLYPVPFSMSSRSSTLYRTHHRKRIKKSKKVTRLRQIIIATALYCVGYLILFFIYFAAGDNENKDGFLRSDINRILTYILSVAYILNIAALGKSFFLDKKLASSFYPYRILGVFLTLIIVAFFIVKIVDYEQSTTNEFMQAEMLGEEGEVY